VETLSFVERHRLDGKKEATEFLRKEQVTDTASRSDDFHNAAQDGNVPEEPILQQLVDSGLSKVCHRILKVARSK